MEKNGTFTDSVINKITIFILGLILIWSVFAAKQTWDKQLVLQERQLLSIATTVLNQVANHFSQIANAKQNQELTSLRKVTALNQVLQNPLEEISRRYPGYGLGYYDIELDSVLARAPDFDPSFLMKVPRTYPYFQSYESGEPEFRISGTSIGWGGKPIVTVTVPVYYEGKIIGHTWTNVKIDDLFLLSLLEAGKTIFIGLLLWSFVLYLLRRKIRLSLGVLNEFSRQIASENHEGTLGAKIPELKPVLEKIQQYAYNLKESDTHCDLSVSLLESMMGGITDGFIALDNDWRCTYINQKAKEIILKPYTDIRGKDIWVEFPEAIGTELYNKLHEAKAKALPLYLEVKGPKEGIYYFYSAHPYPNGITVFIRDITEEKRTKDKEIQLAAIVEASNDSIVSTDLDGIIKSWNPAAERMFGFMAEEVLGKHISILVPEGFTYEEQILETIAQGKRINSLETIRRKKDGEIFHVSLSVSPLIDQNGRVYGGSTIARDRTMRHTLEQALKQEIIQRKQSEAHWKAIFDNSKLGIVTLTLDEKIIQCNPALEKMLGYSQEELVGMHWSTFTYPGDVRKDADLVSDLLEGKRDHYETEKRHSRKDGTVFWTNLTIALSRDPDSEFIIAFVQDITEKKLYQEQMVKLDRLNLVGVMAAGISHEVRNPMTTVRGFLQMLQNKQDCRAYREFFDLMVEELDRANNIITEFLSIGRNTPSNLQKENLNSILDSLKPLIEASAYGQEKYVEVETEEVPVLLLNNKEIRQIILNLCQNGLEAMKPGGKLKIKTFCQEGMVVLAVQDEGEGISPEVLEKIGTPFFTTKPEGTGLGLGICYGIAARHNADISIDTSPQGTTFYVKFRLD